MNKIILKISVCLGFSFLVLQGCESSDNKQANEKIEIFRSMDNMFGVHDESYIDLEGNWRFSIGDDTVWASPDYDDSDWENIKVPSTWEEQGFHGYNGYAWYRKTFVVPKELAGSNFILNAGFIDDIDQTFINGKLVGLTGSFPPQFITAYNAHREYFVQKDLLNEGKNLIAIRVYDSELEGGIKQGVVGLSATNAEFRVLTDLNLDLNLSGKWKFNTGDMEEWKNLNYNDSRWQEIFVPAYWELQGYKDYDGFAWYRKTFTLPEDLSKEKLVLMLGLIDDIDQTYLNGTLIGSIGDWQFKGMPSNFNQNNEWETIRGYYIPANLLHPGKNTISVRVFDGFIDGGIYKGPIGFVTQKKYREFWNKIKETNQQ